MYVKAVDDSLLRPAYTELFKNIPGYVSGDFDFLAYGNSLKFKNLTKENSLKLKELVDHYWEDLMNLGWLDNQNYSNSFLLSEKRDRVYGNFINLKYCAQNSNVGDYAPDGTQYVGKTIDGYCYTAKTELNNLYWLIEPRKLLQLPEGTYAKQKGLGIEFSTTGGEGWTDSSGFYVIYTLSTLISDKGYEWNWTPVDKTQYHWGYITTSPDENIYYIA